MFKRIAILILGFAFLINAYGCIALVAGGAGGAGTAIWLSGKLIQDVNAPFEKAVSAAKSAMDSLKLEITKQTIEDNVAQIKAKYTDGKTVWVDIRRIAEQTSKIEVRVGAVSPDKRAADQILKKIQAYL